MKSCLYLLAAGGLALLAPAAARADVPAKYTSQAIIKHGERVGNTTAHIDLGWAVDSLNDNGQLMFQAFTNPSATLFQYSNGQFVPIVIPRQPAPTSLGKWPNGDIFSLVRMNQNGDAVFNWFDFDHGRWLGTFQWDAKAQKTTALALKGAAATDNLVFDHAGFPMPGINDNGEVVFPAEVVNATGKRRGVGAFYRSADGKLQPVALPLEAGLDGVALDNAYFTTINNSGRVALRARRYGQNRTSAYVWEKGDLLPIVLAGSNTPDGKKIAEVTGAWVNNKNRNVLVEVILTDEDIGPHALYLWSDGNLTPVAVPGQPMPSGGRFSPMLYYQDIAAGGPDFLGGDASDSLGVSYPNDQGQHAFYCLISEGGRSRTAAYLMDADGSLSLIVGSGTTTEVGLVARVGDLNQLGWGYGIALNNKNQVALGLQVAGGVPVLALLTPAAP